MSSEEVGTSVGLRPFRQEDLRDFLSYQGHPDVLRLTPLEALEEHRALRFLHRQTDPFRAPEDGYRVFAIEVLQSSRVIGEIGIELLQGATLGRLGWSMHPDHQRRGFAGSAASDLLKLAFSVWRVHRVTAICDAENVASYRLMERLGMRKEAHFAQSVFYKGKWRDELQYALLQSEWEAADHP